MIRKASEVADDIFDAGRMAYDRDRDEFAKRAIIADRLAIVARLREMADEEDAAQSRGWCSVAAKNWRIAATQLEKEIRQAGEDKHA